MKTQKNIAADHSTRNVKTSFRVFMSSHKWMFMVFFLVLFRAPLMKVAQKHLAPHDEKSHTECIINKKSFKSPVRSSGMIASLNGAFRLKSDSDDDGCGDDEGCETEDDNEYYGNESSADGCSDDEGCESEDDSGYSGSESSDDGCSDDDGCYEESDESNYYGDTESSDGCSCGGEAVVGDPGVNPPPFYNSELVLQVNLSASNRISLKITDLNDYPKAVIQSDVILTAGSHTYRWNGRDQNALIPWGSYRAVLYLGGPVITYDSRIFSFNSSHGFQVNGTQSYTIVYTY